MSWSCLGCHFVSVQPHCITVWSKMWYRNNYPVEFLYAFFNYDLSHCNAVCNIKWYWTVITRFITRLHGMYTMRKAFYWISMKIICWDTQKLFPMYTFQLWAIKLCKVTSTNIRFYMYIKNVFVTTLEDNHSVYKSCLTARFMGPTWSPSRADRTQMGPMLAPWNFLFGLH